jgi:hypothetical protein
MFTRMRRFTFLIAILGAPRSVHLDIPAAPVAKRLPASCPVFVPR